MRIIALFFVYYGCAIYGFFNPFVGLLFFTHITILRPEALAWGSPVFGSLHFISACLVLLGYMSHSKGQQGDINEGYQRTNIRIFGCFIAWLLVVTALAESSVELSFYQTLEMGKIFVLCFLFAKLLNTANRIEIYVWVTSISFGLLSFWGFLQGLQGNNRLDDLWPGGSNMISAALALMGPFVLAKVFDTTLGLKYKLGFIACVVSILLCSIYSESRGGFLGMGIGVVTLILVTQQRAKALAVMVLIVLLASPWVPDSYLDRVSSIFSPKGQRDQSAESRHVLWGIAFRIWQDHPIAGVGLNNYSPVKETYADEVRDLVTSQEMHSLIFNRVRYPHGVLPGMMAETGLVGIGLFLTLLLRNMGCRFVTSSAQSEFHRRLYIQAKGAQAGLIGFAVAGTFSDIQYLELFYLQIFFVGAVRGYFDSLKMRTESEGVPLSISRTAPPFAPTIASNERVVSDGN